MGIIAGILIILLSIAHNIYGERKQVPDMKAITDDGIIIGSLRIMVFQGGILLLAVGIIQILFATGVIELTGIARYFPVGIIALNLSVFLLVAIFIHRALLKITMPQLVIFAVIITLQLLSL